MYKLFLAFLLFSFSLHAQADTQYDYSTEQLAALKDLPVSNQITQGDLEKWDRLLNHFLQNRPFSAGRAIRISAYLYSAQADFASLSKQLRGDAVGSLDPLSLQIIRLFYPFFPTPQRMVEDEYSLMLAQRVVEKYKERLQEEMTSTFSTHSWASKESEIGKEILSWNPWILPDCTLKSSSSPPPLSERPFWRGQLDQAWRAYRSAGSVEKKFARYWGNYLGRSGSNWLHLTNTFLIGQHVALDKLLSVRRDIGFGLYDALIISFHGKYATMIPPPYVANKKIIPYVEYSYYPSYPSADALLSYVSANLLGHYFPEQQNRWINLAALIGKSRIWAGMNYPIDVEIAEQIGKMLSEEILKTHR